MCQLPPSCPQLQAPASTDEMAWDRARKQCLCCWGHGLQDQQDAECWQGHGCPAGRAGRPWAARPGAVPLAGLPGQQSCCASLPALRLAIFLRGKWVIADQLIPSALLLSA